ncbi:hypothetical protein FBU59_005712, partial [Linderina macrospora]
MDDFRGLNWQNRNGGSATSSGNAGRASPMGKQTAAKDDPFGELVSFTSTAKHSDPTKLTLREQLEQKSRNSPTASPKPPQAAPANNLWNFDALEHASTPRSASRTPVPAAASSAMDFDPFASPIQPVQPAKPAQPVPVRRPQMSASLLDDDEPIPMDTNPPPAVKQQTPPG